jgi:hypothetical protein
MSCRTGPLHVGWSLRDGYTPSAGALPMVAMKNLRIGHWKDRGKSVYLHEVGYGLGLKFFFSVCQQV